MNVKIEATTKYTDDGPKSQIMVLVREPEDEEWLANTMICESAPNMPTCSYLVLEQLDKLRTDVIGQMTRMGLVVGAAAKAETTRKESNVDEVKLSDGTSVYVTSDPARMRGTPSDKIRESALSYDQMRSEVSAVDKLKAALMLTVDMPQPSDVVRALYELARAIDLAITKGLPEGSELHRRIMAVLGMLGGPVDTADIEPTSTDRAGLDGEDRAALVRMIEEQRLHLKSTREDFNHMRNKYEADLYQREDALLDARKACKTMREERDLHAAEKRKLAVDLNTMTAVHDARFTMITNTQALLAARRDSSDTDKIVTQIDELKKERTQAANQISYKENALNTARQTIGAQSVTIDKLRVRLGQEVGQNMAVSPVVRAHPFRAYYKQMVTTMSRVDANGHRLITETCSDVPPPNTRVKWSGDNSVIEDTTFAIGDRVKLRSTGAVGTVCSVATASNEFKVRVRFDESVEDAPDQLHVNVNLLEKHVDDAKPVLAPSAPAQECVTTTTPVPAQDLIVRPTYKIGDRVTVLFGAHIGSTRTIVGGNFYDSPYSYKWKLSGDLLLSSADFEHAKEIKIGSFVKLLDDWNMPCGSVLRVDEIVSIGKYRLTYANDNARRFGELQRNGNQIVVVDAPKELS